MEIAERRTTRLNRRFWLLNAAVWSLLAATNTVAVAADLLRAGRPAQWLQLLAYFVAVYAPWFIATPAVFLWVRKFPPTGVGWPRLLLRYLPLVTLWLIFYVPIQSVIGSFAQHGSADQFYATLISIPINQWVIDSVYLVALIGIAIAVHQLQETRQRERQAAALEIENAGLETRLSEARLEMLRAQLEPHFLYNALNSIAALVHQGESQKAVDAVGLLSELLRYATRATDQHEVLLSEELDFAEAYWGFQGLRYGERLKSRFTISPRTLSCALPPLILQPLLENAIRHGVETMEEPSEVELVARSRGDEIEILVSNRPRLAVEAAEDFEPFGTGSGRVAGSGLGVGLRNVRERLQWHYGRPIELELTPTGDAFIARLVLPAEKR